MQKTTRLALLAAAALALPAAARAQTTPAPAPAPAAPPAQAAPAAPADEATQLRQKIAALQQQAMQDPALKPALDSFTVVLNAAMARLDPQAPTKLARGRAINAEVEAARAASDNAKLNQLAAEATALRQYFAELQPRANQDPQVQAARQVWLGRLFEKMKQIDPNAQQYVDRLTQLSQG